MSVICLVGELLDVFHLGSSSLGYGFYIFPVNPTCRIKTNMEGTKPFGPNILVTGKIKAPRHLTSVYFADRGHIFLFYFASSHKHEPECLILKLKR